MAASTGPKDPLESVWVCSLFFGGILLLVSLVGIVRALAMGGEVREPEVWRAWAFLAVVSCLMGPAVAFVRRATRQRSWRTKNAATGIVAGAVYALACTLVAGRDMTTTARAGLGAVVFVGFAWAVASGLNEAWTPKPAPTKKKKKGTPRG